MFATDRSEHDREIDESNPSINNDHWPERYASQFVES
jgi:hypothetical protein